MSWLQTLLQKLKKEDEEIPRENFVVQERPESIPFLPKNDALKDLDAKISYQYPRGTSLRSEGPRKPPEEFLSRRRKKRISEKNGIQEQQKVLPKEQQKVHQKVQQMGQKVSTESTAIKTTPQPRMRGPFQPTEIPSPVYGFNRPNQSRTIVEHELSRFYKDDDRNELKPFNQEKEPIMAVKQPPLSEVMLANDSIHNETADLAAEKMEAPDSPIKANHPENISLIIEDEPIKHQTYETIKKDNSSAKQQHSTVIAAEQSQYNADHSGLEDEAEGEQSERQKRRRSHLPFNVMMLKQDRQSLEARKRRREEERSHIRTPDSLKREEIQEQTEVSQPEIRVEEQDQIQTAQVIDHRQMHPSPKEESGNPVIAQVGIQKETNMQKFNSDGYQFPETSLLNPPISEIKDTDWISEQKELLNQTLQNFNVGAQVVHVTQGPSVTRFEVQPDPGVKVNKITNLSDDIKLSLAARDIRIEAPIPGKHTIGIEVPNQKSRPVRISEIIQSEVFQASASPLTAVLGLDIAGNPIVTDLKKMPHGLIAGATGSGKSVCINSILVSLLYKASPEDLKLLLVDPKMVELAPYNRIPHLVTPVITDVKAATAALKWAVEEMERRYELFAHTGVRDINRFNEMAMANKRYSDKLPFIVIIIDELADLMMMSPADVEEAICRIAQKARACGIHLIIATQRPSVDVITGLIKANIPTRVAFSVSSQVDSRTIIDISGAEKLLGRGDMLFLENGSSKPVRLQGTFVTDEEIDIVADNVRAQQEPEYLFEQEELLKKAQITEDEDELFYEACEFIINQGGASTSSLQRRFKIGYNRAARLMDLLEQNGYITGANGSKAREVLITEADLESIQESISISY